jgi:Holliday junction resolvase RusA-like endonuclease
MIVLRQQDEAKFETTILGEPASKANSRRSVLIGGKPRFIKSKKALDYEKAFIAQCPVINPLVEGDVFVTITIHYRTRRPDLDPSLIYDLLQGRAYVNDRQVKGFLCLHALDADNPRANIKVIPMEGVRVEAL